MSETGEVNVLRAVVDVVSEAAVVVTLCATVVSAADVIGASEAAVYND